MSVRQEKTCFLLRFIRIVFTIELLAYQMYTFTSRSIVLFWSEFKCPSARIVLCRIGFIVHQLVIILNDRNASFLHQYAIFMADGAICKIYRIQHSKREEMFFLAFYITLIVFQRHFHCLIVDIEF